MPFVSSLCAGQTATIVSTATGAHVTGTSGRDLIYGSPAADKINGGDGDDNISSGAGTDFVDGDAGSDRVVADHGDTVVRGTGDVVSRSPLAPPAPAPAPAPPAPVAAPPVVPAPAPAAPTPAPVPTASPAPAPVVEPDPEPVADPVHDEIAPSEVLGVYGQRSAGHITLHWQPSSDDVGVTGYVVTRSLDYNYYDNPGGVLSRVEVGRTTALTLTDTPPDNQVYYYFVTAVDAAENESETGAYEGATLGDDHNAPQPPDELRISSSSAGIVLSWDAGTYDNVGVSRYIVERSTSSTFATDSVTETGDIASTTEGTYVDVPEDATAVYYYRVRAIDVAGNDSRDSNWSDDPAEADGYRAASNVQSASLSGDVTAPTAPASASWYNPDVMHPESSVQITWDASTDAVGVAHYLLQRATTGDFTTFDTVTARGLSNYEASYDLADGSPTYSYRVIAVDAAGNQSDPTTAVDDN